jgi:DNA-binding MarR family transcriptional regulator
MTESVPASEFVDEYLAFLLARASHLVSGGHHARLKKLGVPVATWRVIAVLRDGPCTVGQLAASVLLNQPTMSKTLDRLESDGLVKRVRGDDNRRSVRIELCAKGRKLADRLIPLANTHQSEAFAHLDERERRELVRLLRVTIEHNRVRDEH